MWTITIYVACFVSLSCQASRCFIPIKIHCKRIPACFETDKTLWTGSLFGFVTVTFSLQMMCLLASVMLPFHSRRQSLVVQQSRSVSSENWTGRKSELSSQYCVSKFSFFLNHLFTCYCLQFASVVLVECVVTDWAVFSLNQAARGNGVLNRLWSLSLICV